MLLWCGMSLLRCSFVLLSALAMGPLQAQTRHDLLLDGVNPDNVLTYGIRYCQQRFSKLQQIDKKMSARLGQALGRPGRQEYGAGRLGAEPFHGLGEQ